MLTYHDLISSHNVLGFTFDSTLTWRDHIAKVLSHGKQRLGQLYRCHNFFSSYNLSILYKSWIRPAMEYGCVLYWGAAPTYLHLDTLQTRIEHVSFSTFPSLYNRRSAAILGLVCRLLAGEG